MNQYKENRLERISDESYVSQNNSNISSKTLYSKEDKKEEIKGKSTKHKVKQTKSCKLNYQEERKEKTKFTEKRMEGCDEKSKQMYENNNYLKSTNKQQSKLLPSSNIKQTNEEENEELSHHLGSMSSNKITNLNKKETNLISIKHDNLQKNDKLHSKKERAAEYNNVKSNYKQHTKVVPPSKQNKRSKSSDIKHSSSIKRTNEEENEELMYNLRSTSSDKHTNTIKGETNLISIKHDNLQKNEKVLSKKERAAEYSKKHTAETRDKKTASIKSSYPKEISKESEFEDRPKRTPMNNFITSEKNQLSNISEKNLNTNSNFNSNNVKTNNFFLKETAKTDPKATKKKPKQEVFDINQIRLKLIESNNVKAIIDAEKRNEKEKTKELGKMQHKINCLTKHNRIDVLSQALANHSEEGENNEVNNENIENFEAEEHEQEHEEEEEYLNEQFEKDSKEMTEKKDEVVLNDSIDDQHEPKNISNVKVPVNASNVTNNFRSSLKMSSRSKSLPSIKVRKPKVDSFDFLKKITGNTNLGMKNNDSNTFRKSFSKESHKKNYSKSLKNNSQEQISEVKVDYKTTHLIDHNNFVLAYKEKRNEEQSQQLQRIIQYQKEKRKLEKEKLQQEKEEKSKKILANLIKLNMDTRSRSFQKLTVKSGNMSSNFVVGKNGKKYMRNRSSPKLTNTNNNLEESSYLDNDVYLQQIREFINNDLPREKQFAPNYIKKQNSVKNLTGASNFKRPSSKTVTSVDKNENRSEKNTKENFNNLKSITELSEKNNRLTENTPKNYIISPKDNLQGFEFSNYGINSIKTPNSEEIDKKMNFFESGDHTNKVKINTLKSMESEVLNFAEKNLSDFSNQFIRDNNTRVVDEKAKLTELRNQTNIFKEKFKNMQNAGNFANNNHSKQDSHFSNESFPKNNIELIEKVNPKPKKLSNNNSISFKQNLMSQPEANTANKQKPKDLEDDYTKSRIMEITMHNAAIKIQNFVRYVKYLREHYEEFENQDMMQDHEENEAEEMEGYSDYNKSEHNQQFMPSQEYNEEEIEISQRYNRDSERMPHSERRNNSFDAKSKNKSLSKLDQSNSKYEEEINISEEKQFEISSKSNNKASEGKVEKSDRTVSQNQPSVIINNNTDSKNLSPNYEENLSNATSNRPKENSNVNSERERENLCSNKDDFNELKISTVSARKNDNNSLTNSQKEYNSLGSNQAFKSIAANKDTNSLSNRGNQREETEQKRSNENLSANNSFRSDYSRKCYSVQQNRNNSTIILSPNSVDSPRLHNIIAIKQLIDRQRSEKSLSQSGSELRQHSQNSHNYSQDFYENQQSEENEINNTSDYKNVGGNDSKNDISIRSNQSAGKINLKPKDGAPPKLNLLDLAKKKSNKSQRSETSEQLNISIRSSDKNFEVMNYENSLKNPSNNSNSMQGNLFKSGKNLKNSPRELQSNNNVTSSSKDPIEINNKNNLISSQESSLSRKENKYMMNEFNTSDSQKNQTVEKNDERENLASSLKSNVSVKVFDSKRDANNNPIILNNQLNNSRTKEDALSEHSKNNNSFESKFTFKREYNRREDGEKNSSIDSKKEYNEESSTHNKDKNNNESKVVEKGFIVDIPMPSCEERVPVYETQNSAYFTGSNREESLLNEEEALKGSVRSLKPELISKLSNRDKSEIYSELDIEADKDNKDHIDWQISLNTEKTFDKDNNLISNRSEKPFVQKTEGDEDLKEIVHYKTKEIKENQEANQNNSYNDFIDDENLGSIDENDNSNLTDIMKDKYEEESKKDKSPVEIKSDREDIFKFKGDSQESFKMDNLLDDIKSNSDFNSLSPHIFPSDKDKSTSVINARYQEYMESDRKSQNLTDRVPSDRPIENKAPIAPKLSKEETKIGEVLTEFLLKELISKEIEKLIPKKKNIIITIPNISVNTSHMSNTSEMSRGIFSFNFRFLHVYEISS